MPPSPLEGRKSEFKSPYRAVVQAYNSSLICSAVCFSLFSLSLMPSSMSLSSLSSSVILNYPLPPVVCSPAMPSSICSIWPLLLLPSSLLLFPFASLLSPLLLLLSFVLLSSLWLSLRTSEAASLPSLLLSAVAFLPSRYVNASVTTLTSSSSRLPVTLTFSSGFRRSVRKDRATASTNRQQPSGQKACSTFTVRFCSPCSMESSSPATPHTALDALRSRS